MKALSKNQIEGAYKIHVHTPMGTEEGTLELTVNGQSLSGTITNSKGSTEFSDGIISDNEISFETKIKTPMGRLKAKVSGKIEDDLFTGSAKLPLGTAKIEGKKITH